MLYRVPFTGTRHGNPCSGSVIVEAPDIITAEELAPARVVEAFGWNDIEDIETQAPWPVAYGGFERISVPL